MNRALNIALAGNPNCGKTTLFNAFTGSNLKVANWPGVTVEKKEGTARIDGNAYKVVDLPGIYSITSYTMEEIISRNYILDDEVDVIINIVDASALERNLYLTLQLLELGKPVVVALNMIDVVEQRGMEIDLHRLPEMLGVPVIAISARKRRGLSALMHAVQHHFAAENPFDTPQHDHPGHRGENHHHEHSAHRGHSTQRDTFRARAERTANFANGHTHHQNIEHAHNHHKEMVMVYDKPIEDKIDIVIERLKAQHKEAKRLRWLAIKVLENDAEIIKEYPIELEGIRPEETETEIINQKYKFIGEVIEESIRGRVSANVATDHADKVLTNKFWGIPIFLLIMGGVFFLTFTLGDFIKEYFEMGMEWFSGTVSSLFEVIGAGEFVTSLVVDGIIAGVGGILSFLPNIVIMFIALAVLEDSGYMARVAYIMDGIMSKMGLSGKAFIPMLLGFGCTVPAVMASRSLENKKDRLRTIMVTPFMSCSARLPIYVLFSEAFFPQNPMLAAYSMYLIGIVVAILVALVMSWFSKERSGNMLLIELPEYKTPGARTVFIYVWSKVKEYIIRAGTIIFVMSVVLWFLLSFGTGGLTDDMSESFAAYVGHALVPVLVPAGLGFWQIGVALISGLVAKEVVVSSVIVLFGLSSASSEAGLGELVTMLGAQGFGAINAYALMLFCLLYIPCAATVGVIKRETGSWKYTFASMALQLSCAWVVSTLFYQIARLFM